jgi:hypothetical protein
LRSTARAPKPSGRDAIRRKPVEQAHIVLARTACPDRAGNASRSSSSTRCSAVGCPPACSRRSGRSAGSPTPRTATTPSTPRPACSARTRERRRARRNRSSR